MPLKGLEKWIRPPNKSTIMGLLKINDLYINCLVYDWWLSKLQADGTLISHRVFLDRATSNLHDPLGPAKPLAADSRGAWVWDGITRDSWGRLLEGTYLLLPEVLDRHFTGQTGTRCNFLSENEDKDKLGTSMRVLIFFYCYGNHYSILAEGERREEWALKLSYKIFQWYIKKNFKKILLLISSLPGICPRELPDRCANMCI